MQIDSLSPTPGGHFVLCLYGAVYDLLRYLRSLSAAGSGSFDDVLSSYGFLHGYVAEICHALLPDDSWSAGPEHWTAARKAFEARCTVRLPIAAITEEAALSEPALRLLMLLGLVEEDSRFGSLFAWLQPDSQTHRLTLQLAERIVEDTAGASGPRADGTAWRALTRAGLAEPVDRGEPRAEWTLRTAPELWALIRGETDCPPPLGRLLRQEAPPPGELNFPPETCARLQRAAELLARNERKVVALRADPGADVEQLATSLLAASRRTSLLIDGAPDAGVAKLLGPWCAMSGAAPVFRFEVGPGETATVPLLRGYAGPVIVLLGKDGGLAQDGDGAALTLDLPPLPPVLRRRAWQDALGDSLAPADLPVLEGYRLSEGFIRRIATSARAEAALDGRMRCTVADARSAARSLNHQLLDGLADRLESVADWSRLVAAAATCDMLAELERFARGREHLTGALGPGFGAAGPQGVRALFTGMSGTGKTMAAQLLAGALGKDLYRVDLAAVVNKYIGETEKNLNRVLSRAEALDVVLLLDEGDALLGSRTDVKNANDRYANLETNYLLQRLEHYRGIVLVTTNYGENIDKAFQRRMDVVVPFLRPGPAERQAILALHLPPDHAVGADTLAEVATRCDLTGGQLRNVALRAALLAAAGGPLNARHLLRALATEHQKAGAVFPLAPPVPAANAGGGATLAGFRDALRAGR